MKPFALLLTQCKVPSILLLPQSLQTQKAALLPDPQPKAFLGNLFGFAYWVFPKLKRKNQPLGFWVYCKNQKASRGGAADWVIATMSGTRVPPVAGTGP